MLLFFVLAYSWIRLPNPDKPETPRAQPKIRSTKFESDFGFRISDFEFFAEKTKTASVGLHF
jgi:hypothetical protein